MPSPYVKKLAGETGKSIDEVEGLWKKAKKATAEHFGISEDQFESEEYAYTVGIVKKMCGVDEQILDVANFLNSKKSAKEFVEDTISGPLSAQIGPDPVIPPKDKNNQAPKPKDEEEAEPAQEPKEPKKAESTVFPEPLSLEEELPPADLMSALDKMIDSSL